MSWSEVKKINNDLNKTLDVLIEEKTGVVNATGGTATSGGIFAKLNKLLTDWTTTRAGKIDNIDTTVSSRASQTSITTLQNTINTINGNVVAPAIIMKNPRLVHLGASLNRAEITINMPLNVRIVRLVEEWSGTYKSTIDNRSSTNTCVINGVTIPLVFIKAINSPYDGGSTGWGAVDKIFTAPTSFAFTGSYGTPPACNVYALICDI